MSACNSKCIVNRISRLKKSINISAASTILSKSKFIRLIVLTEENTKCRERTRFKKFPIIVWILGMGVLGSKTGFRESETGECGKTAWS